jgi:hypothetical protein
VTIDENESTAGEPTWAVLVVHGVGFTRPGQTLDSFMSGLESTNGSRLRETGPPSVLMLDKSPEEIPPHKYEDRPADLPRVSLPERFPMHLRQIRIDTPHNGTPKKALFAEVFWSDISITRNHAVSILLRLVTIIFQLRFVVDRAATMPDGTARWLRFVLYLGSLVLCGPMAALNVVIMILLLSHFISLRFQSWTDISLDPAKIHWTLIAFGLAIFSAALWVILRKHSDRNDNPWRLLSVWLGASGLVLALLAGFKSFAPESALARQFDQLLQYEFDFHTAPDALSFYFFSLMMLVRWSFSSMLGLLIVAIVGWSWAASKAWRFSKAELIPGLTAAVGVLVLQIGLWVVIIPALAIWVFQQLSMEVFTRSGGPFGRLQTFFVLNLGLAAVVSFCVVITWMRRRRWVRRHAQDYSEVNVARTIPRLLINNVIFTGLFVASVAGALLVSLIAVARGDLLESYTGWVTGGTAAVITIVGLLLLNAVGSGLHILMDIVSHFIMARLPIPWPRGKQRKPKLNDLVRQMKIEARFRRVLEEVLARGNVSHLTVIAHSQGTVIALDVLWHDWAADLLQKKQVRNLLFITMGSPFTHLYQRYFPDRYPVLFRPDGTFNEDEIRGWGKLYQNLTRGEADAERCAWINLFRVDDPIGTHIDGNGRDQPGTFPKNRPLPRGGHTHYWSDKIALREMKDLLPG